MTTPTTISIPQKGKKEQMSEDLRPVVLFGYAVLFGFFVVLCGWAAYSPLASAVIVNGNVVVEGQHRVVQHREGGILKEILVKDGDMVDEGQVLARMDDTDARTQVSTLSLQYQSLLAADARLKAERDNSKEITFPKELLDQPKNDEIAKIMQSQTDLFLNRKKSTKAHVDVLEKRIEQLREQAKGTEAQAKSQQQQLALIQEELKGTQELFEQGYAAKTRVLALQRTVASLTGQLTEYNSSYLRTQEAINETNLSIQQIRKERMTEVQTQLSDIQDKIFQIRERMLQLQEALQRVEIRSPARGWVVNLRKSTVGAVLTPADTLLEVVPSTGKIYIEAPVRPIDIVDVHVGMPAEVRMVAFRDRYVPHKVPGVVSYLSPDSLHLASGRSDSSFYRMLVEVDIAEVEKVPGAFIVPGMPMDIVIPTKERTVLSYLLAPYMDAFAIAFREK